MENCLNTAGVISIACGRCLAAFDARLNWSPCQFDDRFVKNEWWKGEAELSCLYTVRAKKMIPTLIFWVSRIRLLLPSPLTSRTVLDTGLYNNIEPIHSRIELSFGLAYWSKGLATMPTHYNSATRECEERPTTPSRREDDEEYDPEAGCRVRKKRAPAKQREWIEYGRRDWDEWSQEDIDKKICGILTDLNWDAGLGTTRVLVRWFSVWIISMY